MHLIHCSATLNLYGTLCGSELSSNLLIEHSRNDQGDYLLLSRCQRVEAPPEISRFFLLFTSRTVPIEGHTNGIQEILVTDWLSKKFDRSGFDSTHAHWNIAVPSEKDYWDANISRRKLALEIESTQSR
jgi:hypothetical protein